ncbi:MAG: LOG family protein [Sedimentisphaerales bacterium]|nr:LOG family protein [Sedimentisphaerales bacterium]
MVNKTITIFGTSRAKPGDEIFELAYEMGGSLAQAGFTLANGGYGGTMLAAAKGANQAGGEVIGITCSAFKSKANEFITKEIITASLDERLDKLIELGDHYVVLPGGTGTLLELAKVWELKNKDFLSTDKSIIIIGGLWDGLLELIAKDDADGIRHIRQAAGPKQVVDFLNSLM